MDEGYFIDISIVGNNKNKPPRKEVKTREGKDQFLITFSLSGNANGAWIESFNRVCAETSKQTRPLQVPIVKDDLIQIICPLDDQLQGQLDDLKSKVSTANQVYREQLRAIDKEKRSNDEILQKLRF